MAMMLALHKLSLQICTRSYY